MRARNHLRCRPGLRQKLNGNGIASYGRVNIGAFLPVIESGSGSVYHELGGCGFETSGLTPLERVCIELRPGGASPVSKKREEENGERDEDRIEQGSAADAEAKKGSGPIIPVWK